MNFLDSAAVALRRATRLDDFWSLPNLLFSRFGSFLLCSVEHRVTRKENGFVVAQSLNVPLCVPTRFQIGGDSLLFFRCGCFA